MRKLNSYRDKPIIEMTSEELIEDLVEVTSLYHASLERIRVQVERENRSFIATYRCKSRSEK